MVRLSRTKKTSTKINLPSPDTHSDPFAPKRDIPPIRPVTFSFESKKERRSIDFFSLLQYREYIAGLTAWEDCLVYTLYRSISNSISPDAFGEESFPVGIINNGMVRDEQQYATTIRQLFRNISGLPTSSVILSVSPQHIWMTTLEFPKTLDKNSLAEAIDLYFEFTLPFPKNESYIDWEILDDQTSSGIQRVSVGAVYKQYIDPYLEALKKEGVTAIAVESHLMSVARCFGNGRTLFIIAYPSGAHFGAYADDIFRFQRFIPWEYMQRKTDEDGKKDVLLSLMDEIGHIVHFLRTETYAPFETENLIIIAAQDFQDSLRTIMSAHSLFALFKDTNNEVLSPAHLIARGAALRGLLPRKDDTIMSFTAVGTEKIYEWKRAISFSAFFEKLAIGLSLFFVLVYAGSFMLIATLTTRAENRQIAQGAISQDVIKIQDEAKRFNETVEEISKLNERSLQWKKLFDHMANLTNPGVTITSFSVDNPSKMTLTGVAANRDALLQFKALMNSSGIFQDIELPFTLLITKENLPFRFSLLFRDTTFLLTP